MLIAVLPPGLSKRVFDSESHADGLQLRALHQSSYSRGRRKPQSLQLPDDIWANCLSFLSSVELAVVQLVSRYWYTLGRKPLARLVASFGPHDRILTANWFQMHRCLVKLTLHLPGDHDHESLLALSALRVLSVNFDIDERWTLPTGLAELHCQRLTAVQGTVPRILPALRHLTATEVPRDLRSVTPHLVVLQMIRGPFPVWYHCAIDSWPASLRFLSLKHYCRCSNWPDQLQRLDIPSLHSAHRPRPELPSGLKSISVQEWSWWDVIAVGPATIHLDVLEVKGTHGPAHPWTSATNSYLGWERRPNFQAHCLLLGSLVVDRLEAERDEDLQALRHLNPKDQTILQHRSKILALPDLAPSQVQWIVLPIREGSSIPAMLVSPLVSCHTIWYRTNPAKAPHLSKTILTLLQGNHVLYGRHNAQ